jgi:hypothetical protein
MGPKQQLDLKRSWLTQLRVAVKLLGWHGVEQLAGFCCERAALVYEAVPGVQLEALLAKSRPESQQQQGATEVQAEEEAAVDKLAWPLRVLIAAGLAESIHSVHQAGVYHLDITPRECRPSCSGHRCAHVLATGACCSSRVV